jgi:hypothetical protein
MGFARGIVPRAATAAHDRKWLHDRSPVGIFAVRNGDTERLANRRGELNPTLPLLTLIGAARFLFSSLPISNKHAVTMKILKSLAKCRLAESRLVYIYYIHISRTLSPLSPSLPASFYHHRPSVCE